VVENDRHVVSILSGYISTRVVWANQRGGVRSRKYGKEEQCCRSGQKPPGSATLGEERVHFLKLNQFKPVLKSSIA
jgi:hypothetical protein